MVSTSAVLVYKHLRSSLGAVDPEKGYQGRLEAFLNTVRFERFGAAAWRGFPLFAGTLDVGVPLPAGHGSRLNLPSDADAFDEPFADSSAIATHYVSALAAGPTKDVLSGDGGDEVFGGYVTYQADRLALVGAR